MARPDDRDRHGAGSVTTEPRLAHSYDTLAEIAAQVADERATGDPRFVEQGRLTEQQSADRIRVARALAAEWRALANLNPPPAPTASNAELRELLLRAGETWHKRAATARKVMISAYQPLRDFDLYHLYSMVDTGDRNASVIRPYLVADTAEAALAAMLWWHGRMGVESIRFLREVTADLRRRASSGVEIAA